MIQLGIDEKKRLYLSSGASFAGETGTTGSLTLPLYFGGVAFASFDAGNLYIKYGDNYAAIELEAMAGTVAFDVPDAVLGEAGTIKIWAEFTADSGAITQKTSVLDYIVGAAETYVASEAVADGEGGAE